jgi:hypothetical protein
VLHERARLGGPALGAVGGATALMALAGAALAAGLTAPVKAPILRDNAPGVVSSAIDASGRFVSLQPAVSGRESAQMELASGSGHVRSVRIGATVHGFDVSDVAIGGGEIAALWDTLAPNGNGSDRLELATGTFAAPPTQATTVATSPANFEDLQVAVSMAGTVFATWTGAANDSGAEVLAAAGGKPTVVPLPGVGELGAAIDSAGSLEVIDEASFAGCSYELQTLASDGTLSTPSTFSIPQAAHQDDGSPGCPTGVLFDAAGDQLFTWTNEQSPPYALWRSASGTLGPPQKLGSADAIAVPGLGAGGQAAVALFPTPNQHNPRGPVQLRLAGPLGTFGAPTAVGPNAYVNNVSLQVDGAGRALLAWDGSGKANGEQPYELSAVARAGRVGRAVALPAGPAGYRGHAFDPFVTADPSAPEDAIDWPGAHGGGLLAFRTH